MRASNVDRGGGPDGPGRTDDESDPVSQPASPSPRQQNMAGPLIGLSRDEPRPPAGSRRTSSLPNEDPLPKSDAPKRSVNAPFIVDHNTRSITKFGQPCLVPLKDKSRPLTRREFEAAALLIANMGQYVSIEKICAHLQAEPASLQPIIVAVRRALELGSHQKLRDSSLVLMPDGRPARGYGIFVAPRSFDDFAPNDSPRGTLDALLSDLEPDAKVEADLVVLSADAGKLVVQFEEQIVRLHIGNIMESAKPHIRVAPGPSRSDRADDVDDVLIGWDRSRGVYGIRRFGRSAYISNALLDEARTSGLAYSLDSSADVANNVFTVESTFAAQPASLATALKQCLEHLRSQAEGIPTNITLYRDAQAMILERLGSTRHGLLGVNPLPIYDLPAPYPTRVLLYVDRIMPHWSRGYFEVRPVLAGKKQGLVTSFYQREGIATLVLGLHEQDDATLVVAWDPAGYSARKDTRMSVNEETLRSAKQRNDVVSQSRPTLSKGRSEEVLAAPLEHLDKLIEARLRTNPKQRMIDALGGDACVREHLNEHTWTMMIDASLFHVQWCGPLLRGGAPPHIRPFSVADRFVAPAPDAVVLYAGHDPERDVVVLWRHAPGEYMHADMVFGVPDTLIEDAARTGMATHVTRVGSRQIAFREAAAATYESDPLTSALGYLSREQDHREIWHSRSADIHEQLSEHLRPIEPSDWAHTRIRPWPIAIELPTLGTQSLDVFAYRAQASETRSGSIAITIQPFIPGAGWRTSLFAAGREPVLLGEWDGIYILFDPRARPTVVQSLRILVTVSRDHLEVVRKRGLVRMTRPLRRVGFEETVIFATGERLLEALDLRLRTLPTVNLELIRENLDMNDPQALAEMAVRLQYAMRLPDRDTLTGTRDVPDEMIVVTGPPDGIEVVVVENEIRRALQTKRTTDDAHLLWMHSNGTGQAALLHVGLRTVLQEDEAPRWPAPEQFDVLGALMQAAVHEGTVSDELVQIACRNSLQWLFIGRGAPFELHRQAEPGSYQVRLRQAVAGAGAGAGRSIELPRKALDLAINHASLYSSPKARPDIVWAFIKRVGPDRILPKGSGDDVVFELDGQRIRVYGLTKTLRRSEDGRTDYVIPALSHSQLSRIRSNPNDQHVFAAFAPGHRNHAWVFWSVRPHLGQLHDPGYRLHVSADLPDGAVHEWRQLDENREERVVIYRGNGLSMRNSLKRLIVELPHERFAMLEAQASKSDLTLGQVLGVMKPADQIAMAMQYGLAPYDRRYGTTEIEDIGGVKPPSSTAFLHAVNLARASREAGEPLPEPAEIIRLLRDPRAERFMGSRTLLTMLWDLYGLEPGVKPATLTHVFRDRGLNPHALHALYRELVMRLIRGANKLGVSTAASFDIGTPVRAGASPAATQIEIEVEADPAMPLSTQPALADEPTPEEGRHMTRDEIAAAIALPDNEQLATSYASAVARVSQSHDATWPPDVALPVALSRLPPDVELIMRAYLGVWPYPHRYTAEQVATEFDIRSQARSRLLIRLASDELLAHAESLSGIVLPAKDARPTLERLATLLIDRADVLTDDELNAVLARHGLATVAALVTEATRQGVLSEFRPSLQYRRAVQKLTGEVVRTTETDEDEPFWKPEQIDEFYKRIDAGEYARLLLLLRDPATRDETFADMALRGLIAASNRASHRTSAMQGRRRNTMQRQHTTLGYEDAVTRTLGFNPDLETFLQRADTLDAVLDRALAATDEETQWLQSIVDDGDVAYNTFLQGNIRLAYFAAIRSGYSEDKPETHEIFDDAFSGLQRAVWGYNPKMSFAFSNYAFTLIRSRILRMSAARYAQRLDVSLGRAEEIIMTRATRNQLRQQVATIADEQRREPTLEELARAVLESRLRRRLVNQLKTEPTATQLRAGWRKYMPEFLRRIEENLELVNTYDRVTRATSLDRDLRDGDDRTLHDIVGSRQQAGSAFPGDEPDSSALADDLQAAFDEAGMSEHEQFTLGHQFGITGYTQLPMKEIAVRQGISEDAVPGIIASAVAKIRQSSKAQTLLMPYLHRQRDSDDA